MGNLLSKPISKVEHAFHILLLLLTGAGWLVIYLPRIFIYRSKAKKQSSSSKEQIMEKKRVVIRLSAIVIISFTLMSMQLANAASPIQAGSVCKMFNQVKTYQGKTYTCIKSGKKFFWSKGVKEVPAPVPSLTPSPVVTPVKVDIPTTPTSFENLFENRKGISYAAWSKVSQTIAASKSKIGTLELLTGPNTKPNFEAYPLALDLVSRAFPNSAEPSNILVIRYNYKDLEWATTLLREKISTKDFSDLDRIEGGRLLSSNCAEEFKTCRGSKQQTVFSSRLALVLQGVDTSNLSGNSTTSIVSNSGMLEAHEYFHALQRIPIMGKTNYWPPTWFVEGSAAWIQNSVINSSNFLSYKSYLNLDCDGQCKNLSELEIADFLKIANTNQITQGFDKYLNYNLGSRFVESLVALKGQESIIEMFSQMATNINFDIAFKNVYGIEFASAIPILAKVIYSNISDK